MLLQIVVDKSKQDENKFHLAFLEISKVNKKIESKTITIVAPLGIDT